MSTPTQASEKKRFDSGPWNGFVNVDDQTGAFTFCLPIEPQMALGSPSLMLHTNGNLYIGIASRAPERGGESFLVAASIDSEPLGRFQAWITPAGSQLIRFGYETTLQDRLASGRPLHLSGQGRDIVLTLLDGHAVLRSLRDCAQRQGNVRAAGQRGDTKQTGRTTSDETALARKIRIVLATARLRNPRVLPESEKARQDLGDFGIIWKGDGLTGTVTTFPGNKTLTFALSNSVRMLSRACFGKFASGHHPPRVAGAIAVGRAFARCGEPDDVVSYYLTAFKLSNTTLNFIILVLEGEVAVALEASEKLEAFGLRRSDRR